MKYRRLLSLGLTVAACAALLSACGGDDKKNPPVTSVPPTATVAIAEPTIAPTLAPTEPAAATTLSPASAEVAAQGTPVAVTVILTDFRISAFQKEFEVGRTYSFTIQNNGAVPHQFMIEKLGSVNVPLTAGGTSAIVEGIAPGATATLTWTFTEAGTYQFASHEKDYFEQGMVQSNIVVK